MTNLLNFQFSDRLALGWSIVTYFCQSSENRVAPATGYIFQDSDFRVPLDASKFSNSLQVSPGKTLALIGGNILLNGGILSNRDGRIEIISIERGKLNIEPENNKLFLKKDSNVLFNDIALKNNSLIFVNSYEGKDNTINIEGSNIKILSGSSVFSQNQGNKLNGEIKINASNLLEIKESTPLSLSSIFTSNFGITPGENIQIIANKIDIEGAQIATTNFSKASGGNITVISNDFNSAGSTPSPVNPFGYGGINSFNYNSGSGGNITGKIKNLIIQNNGTLTTTTSLFSGQGGNLNLTSENITLKNGGNLGSLSFGNGKGGDVLVNTNNFKLIGQTEIQSSSVTAITFGNGNAGNLAINTLNLLIREGGTVSTNTYTSGNAGNININAFNSIEVSKKSSITSAADFLSNDTRRAIFNFSSPLSGNAGSITLNTFNLNVTNDAMVSVRNTGSGNAGNINITANKVNISNGGGITATTAIAEGGNIGIESNIVQLNNGTISATAGQQGTNGNGGNIRINADVITGFNNSSITANAFKGRGGNIRIKTQGLFLSRNSLLTASSQQGIDGTVETNASRTQSELAKVKAQLPTPTPEIASVCPGKAGAVAGKFVNRGRESAPVNFDNILYNRVFLEDDSVAIGENEDLAKKPTPAIEETKQIVPAQGWVFDSKGQVTLVATNPNEVTPDSLLNANSCSSVTPVSQRFPSVEARGSND
ncbi:filamentous hemagglutinin-like protein (plasmid) [Anabaenopsis circularis NIES-21]|uniref:Filamentous hemagglutinin-like protein n=1 Tax=Anabaenopsis circularis NIES-21 TaxID=1085406 RepID=A0A1Z4GRE7_9CYAN|nr:filamentous hemagglutinin-like protein [Anabaenopsis circularis NIES-21]